MSRASRINFGGFFSEEGGITRKQQGQSAVEFALMAPIIFMMIFGMIYGGIMFMQYMHYSNAVRTAARQIAVSTEANRESMKEDQKKWLTELWKKEAGVKFYEPTVNINIVTNPATDDTDQSRDVVINVTFLRAVNIPVVLDMVDFPPKTINTIQYRMRVEEANSSTENTDTENDTENNANTGGTG